MAACYDVSYVTSPYVYTYRCPKPQVPQLVCPKSDVDFRLFQPHVARSNRWSHRHKSEHANQYRLRLYTATDRDRALLIGVSHLLHSTKTLRSSDATVLTTGRARKARPPKWQRNAAEACLILATPPSPPPHANPFLFKSFLSVFKEYI